jgi:hypothetical protein
VASVPDGPGTGVGSASRASGGAGAGATSVWIAGRPVTGRLAADTSVKAGDGAASGGVGVATTTTGAVEAASDTGGKGCTTGWPVMKVIPPASTIPAAVGVAAAGEEETPALPNAGKGSGSGGGERLSSGSGLPSLAACVIAGGISGRGTTKARP